MATRVMADLSSVPQEIQDDLLATQSAYEVKQSAVALAQADYATAVQRQQETAQGLHEALNKLTTDIVQDYSDKPPTPGPMNR
jgi:uncharacterized alpha-E superfamily protein